MGNLADIIRQVWPEWTVEKPIGRGAFGQVYQAVRVELGFESRCAIKVIAVPPDPSDVEALRLEDMEDEEIRQYYRRMAESFAGEIRMLDALKGAPHIVGIEDYWMAENPETLGWIILIRMELLKPFPIYVKEHRVTEAETVRLGDELCEALEVCHGQHVIHRDIKPQNIFVDRFGSFRLGDFGIARKMESLTVSMSQKGTYGYIAPEVNNGQHYDERADIYSLGLVMYQLTNGGKMPFVSTEEDTQSPEKRTEALQRRLRGEELPPPCAASPGLSEVILKACRYRPEERYRTAAELKDALAALTGSAPAVSASVPSAQPEQPVQPGVPREPHTPDTVGKFEDKAAAGEAKNRAKTGGKPKHGDGEHSRKGEKIAFILAALVVLTAAVWGIWAIAGRKGNGAAGLNIDTPYETSAGLFSLPFKENEEGRVFFEPELATVGDTVKLTAVPKDGYRFTKWIAEGIDLEKQENDPENSFVLPAGAYSLTADFSKLYSITIDPAENGTGSVMPHNGAAGDTVTLSAVPEVGYSLDRWEIVSGECSLSGNELTVGEEDVTIRPVFKEISYKITVTKSGNGTASSSKTIGSAGDTVTLTASPDEGYRFVEWRKESEGGTLNGNEATLGAEDLTVRAVFEAIPYTIVVTSSGNGAASASKTTGFIGETVTLTASPDAGYRFVEWRKESEGGTLNGNEATLGAEDLTVAAVFETIPYKITVTSTGNGTASASAATGSVGDTVTLTASPAEDYMFKGWEVLSGRVKINGNTFTVGTEDINVNAVFEEKQYTITVTDDGHGKAQADKSTASKAQTVTLSAVPKDGYVFKEWKILSGSVEIRDDTFTTGTEDVRIQAVFVKGSGGFCGDHLRWRVESESGTLVISGSGNMYDFDYGEQNNAPWGEFSADLKTLVLEEGVTSIGARAFLWCQGFRGALTIPDSVTEIGKSAFAWCSGFTGSLVLPEGIATIGNSAFLGCSGFTGDLTIPDRITAIGERTFYWCRGFNGTLTVPKSVKTIGAEAFERCGFSSARFYGPSPEVEIKTGESGIGAIFEEAVNQELVVFCTTGNYDSFVKSSGWDAATRTWYGHPIKTFRP